MNLFKQLLKDYTDCLVANDFKDSGAAKLALIAEHEALKRKISELEKENSSLKNHRDLLANTLGKCIIASGIVRENIVLSGPELIFFGEDLVQMLEKICQKMSTIEAVKGE